MLVELELRDEGKKQKEVLKKGSGGKADGRHGRGQG